MRMRLVTRTSVVIVALAASPCFGWGRDGHKISGTIATHYLTPDAKAAVQTLLADQSLADVSTWADEIKSDPSYRWACAGTRRGEASRRFTRYFWSSWSIFCMCVSCRATRQYTMALHGRHDTMDGASAPRL